MYQINTILTFTSLTHASAAADLFGVDALYTHNIRRAEKIKGFHPAYIADDTGELVTPDYWTFDIDTPEKVKWFEPQVLDAFKYCGGISIIREIRGDKILHDRGILKHSDIKAIIQRNDQPFPQPQDVKLGEGV